MRLRTSSCSTATQTTLRVREACAARPRGPVTGSRVPGASFRRHPLARQQNRPPLLVSPRLSGRARSATARPSELLGLRQPCSSRVDRRALDRRARHRLRLPQTLCVALPDPPSAADRRLPRERREINGGRQHLGLQLPVCDRRWPAPLVVARLRPRRRRESGGESLPRSRRRAAARGTQVSRPFSPPTRNGLRRRSPGTRLRRRRLVLGRELVLPRLPAL